MADTPQKSDQVVGSREGVTPLGDQPPQARIWNALVIQSMSERTAAKVAGVKRNQVQKWKAVWVGAGWARVNKKGGLIPTDKAPKNLVGEWSDTPQGSPLEAPAPKAHRLLDPHRLHRRKMKGTIGRGTDITSKRMMVKGSRHGLHKAVSYTFHLRAETIAGVTHLPVQVIQRKPPLDHTVVVQSCNYLVPEVALRQMSYEETHAWVKEQTTLLLRSWLGRDADHLSELEFVGMMNEDMEVAWEAHKDAPVGGDVQRDGHGVDQSDKTSPWDKEEETTLRVKKRLDEMEAMIQMMNQNQDRLSALVNEGFTTIMEQMDDITFLMERNK